MSPPPPDVARGADERRGLAPLVAGGLVGLLAGVVADIAWLGWSGWGTLGGVALGTAAGALLGRGGRSRRGDS